MRSAMAQTTGTLPASAIALLPNDANARFMNDLSVGVSYATENRMTFNLEYHFHQAGFSLERLEQLVQCLRASAASFRA